MTGALGHDAIVSVMTFVHIGDMHGRFDVLDRVVQDAQSNAIRTAEPVSAWLLPGDLFDSRSTVEHRNALRDSVFAMAELAPVVACYGNHDVSGDLDIFGDLGTRWPVHVVSTPDVIRVLGSERQVAFVFVLPWPTPAGLIARGVSQLDMQAASRAALEAIFVQAGSQLADARRQGYVTAAIGHAEVSGSIRTTGQPAIGQEIALDQGLLTHLGGCYIGLNHIHNAQEVGEANYAGSICRLSWGETDPKSYTVVRYDVHGNYVWSRRPVDVPPMWHVEAKLTRDGLAEVHATDGPEGKSVDMPASWSGCEVRLRASYRQSEGIVLGFAEAQARAQFKDALRFKFEPVCVPDRAVRAPQVAVARTLAEKLEAWADVTGTTLPAAVTEKLRGLEADDADLLVAAVTERLESLARARPEMEAVAAL